MQKMTIFVFSNIIEMVVSPKRSCIYLGVIYKSNESHFSAAFSEEAYILIRDSVTCMV